MQEQKTLGGSSYLAANEQQGKARFFTTRRITMIGVLAAISCVLVFVNFPIIPAAAHLRYDLADLAVLFAAFTLGPVSGLLVLGIAALFQAFVLGGNGPIGFFMHFLSSGIYLVVASAIYRRMGANQKSLAWGLGIGGLCVVLVMIPFNFIFTPMLGVPVEAVKALMLPGIIPFNLIKVTLNMIVFLIVFRRLQHLIKVN